MDLYCAIDIMNSTAVRLTRGEFGDPTDFGDPVALAERYVDAGARRLHVVDLDAALAGSPINRRVVVDVVNATGVPVQVGGGARTFEDVSSLLEAGVDRVVLGTVAVEDPDLTERLAVSYPKRIAIGIDHKQGVVAFRGWVTTGSLTTKDVLDRISGLPVASVIVTAIERDGMMSGPDTAGLAEVLAQTTHPLVASGGVSSTDDLESLASMSAAGRRIAGVIVGRALANGALGVTEAMAACAQSE
jgi:phosphoribosylformimino-5-aminoimidazole carboxamide ribotide isomerase